METDREEESREEGESICEICSRKASWVIALQLTSQAASVLGSRPCQLFAFNAIIMWELS